jgi:hypothetical protein
MEPPATDSLDRVAPKRATGRSWLERAVFAIPLPFPCRRQFHQQKFRCRANLVITRKILVKIRFLSRKEQFSGAETNFFPAVRERTENATPTSATTVRSRE